MSELDNNNQTITDADQEIAESTPIDQLLLEEMLKAGVLYGRSKSKTHPKMKKYTEMVRNGIELFDPVQTLDKLKEAKEFLQEIAKKGGLILLVGTLPAAQESIKAMADKFGLPYVTNRWLGGTLTNYKTLSQRLHYYMNLKADRETGKLEKYTKKERFQFDKEINRLTTLFGGLEKYDRLPEVLLVVDAEEHDTGIREAKRLKIPVVALVNSNTNPVDMEYIIPCNSNAKSSVVWVLNHLHQGIEQGQQERNAVAKMKEEVKKEEVGAKDKPTN
ncbi:MAG: 30S ribosomal protein S2 [bacterium]|nr:30S ribosomal protein S2 [bacterium]